MYDLSTCACTPRRETTRVRRPEDHQMAAAVEGESPPPGSFCGTPCLPTAVPPLPLGSFHFSAWEKPKPAHQNAPAVPPPPLAGIAPMVLCGGIVATRTSCSDSPSESILIQIWYQGGHRPAVLGMESGQDQLQAMRRRRRSLKHFGTWRVMAAKSKV